MGAVGVDSVATAICGAASGSLTDAGGTVSFGLGAVAALGAAVVLFGDRRRRRSGPAAPVARPDSASSADGAGAGVLVRFAGERRTGAADSACAAGAAEVSPG